MHIFTSLLLLMSLFASSLYSEDEPSDAHAISSESGYTINYDTVSIIEYIRFASKICSVNFLFNTEDLDFTVTVISDAPITSQNVMATLLQTLRVHGLELLEQDHNLVIHKATGVQQIAQLITEKGQETTSPIVTRVFRVSNLKPESIAAIIRPMISTASILEVSSETRQIILTDITANIDKVAALIEILESPYNPLEVQSYQPLHTSP
ncbi:MAG: hypothetical protein HY324_02300, partial [Chlamydiia bacterium]|nr:hypothetical protein [Chlamydiia bacterium]